MFRTHTCNDLRLSHAGQIVTLSGWVHKSRKLGGMTFIDLRDRYGVTQLVIDESASEDIVHTANGLGREYVIKIVGKVVERSNKNTKIPTGDVEVMVSEIEILNKSLTPPFTIEDNSDGGDDIRAKYRYIDIRRNPVKNALILRHKLAHEVRNYLNNLGFLEIETPYLIKSTPEGARDFVVPSRVNPGQFYALPQSPQTFKQLLMVGGCDRYFQIVRCFRDEDLRADRQPEFTQIDCEMSFVEQEDVLSTFEGMMVSLFKNVLNKDIQVPIPRISWHDAMDKYGSDKPDIRFGMIISEVTDMVKGKGFGIFDESAYVGGFAVEGASEYTRKQTDELTEWVKRPQIGAKGLVYIKYGIDKTIKSSIDKFYSPEELLQIAEAAGAKPGDLILLMSGNDKRKVQNMLGNLRIEMGNRMGMRNPFEFAPLWVVDFPLVEWDDETKRFYAIHHPFTAPKPEHIDLFNSDKKEDLEKVCANAYDFVLNGTELGGGSIRIHNSEVQKRMFEILGIGEAEAEEKFGFIINAFRYGAPPHGGLAFGFDRICSLFGGSDSIRDYIAFPKNNQARDVMIDSPSQIDKVQLDELGLKIQS